MIKKRHRARALALQMLYAEEFGKRNSQKTEDSALFVFSDNDEEDVRAYSLYLVAGVREKKDEIDSVISKFSNKRRIDEIAMVDLCILRIAIFSILYDKEIHSNVVIDESVKLSREFSTEINYRFINGVLDTYVKSLKLQN